MTDYIVRWRNAEGIFKSVEVEAGSAGEAVREAQLTDDRYQDEEWKVAKIEEVE